MDAYDATRIVLSRIQSMDPENASKIMGLLLIQDHGDKEMIRLAFGPEALLHSVVLKARKDLGLLPPSSPYTPSSPSPSPFLLARQNSASRLLSSNGGAGGHPSPSSWAPPPVFSRNAASSNGGGAINGVADDLHGADDLTGSSASYGVGLPGSSSCTSTAAPFLGGDLIEEFQLLDQLSFLNDPSAAVSSAAGSTPSHALHIGPKGNGADLFYPDMVGDVCRSPSSHGDGMLFPFAGVSWGMNNHHRRSYSAVDRCLSSEACSDFGWRPCLYFARGYCKNGNSCRFLHGQLPDDAAATKMDGALEQHFHELLLRSKTQRQLGSAPQLMATAASFPYSPSPASPSAGKCMNFPLQPPPPPQNESRRVAAAAAAFSSLGAAGGEEQQHSKFGRPRLDRIGDYAGPVNPGSRQIYLTFPADCTFREEDVANYFSIYGPVQDVRIPYQQKRMFGFVTFVYPETVKLILAKGNPHFVCDARVLVKPYKEKGKVPDRKQQQQDADRGVFSGCSTPTALDTKLDPYDLQLLGASMLYNSNQEMLLRKKQLEDQHQAAQLQQAIELRRRRFTGLQLLDLKSRHLSSAAVPVTSSPGPINTYATTVVSVSTPNAAVPLAADQAVGAEALPRPEAAAIGARAGATGCVTAPASQRQPANDAAAGACDEEDARDGNPKDDGGFKESAEHNLPDSPFASPTKRSFAGDAFSLVSETTAEASSPVSASLDNIDGISNSSSNNNSSHLVTSSLLPAPSTLDVASFNSCFFPLARFSSSGHGAVGM